MSGGSVLILAPNGRRNTIKYTPNTTILQILEEVCKKQNLKAEEYDLKHHNKILDTTSIFRFSGLPNNAQLELVPATKVRCESEITLAVNLENGSRLVGNFIPNQTLLSVLTQLCPDCLSPEKNPVVIYMRQEIYGQNLETATLRSLGITSGRAMVRLIDKAPEDLKVQANVATPLAHKPVEEKPYVRKLKEPSKIDNKNVPTDQNKVNLKSEDVKEEPDTKSNNVNKSQNFKKGGTIDLVKLAKEKRKSTDPSFNQEKRPNISNEPSNPTNLGGTTQTVKACECKRSESMEVDCCGKCQENCVNLVPDENFEDQFVFLGERNAMLFSFETAQAIPSEDLPDEFFDLTIDDAKRLIRDVRRQQHNMQNTPLMTSALRNLEESKRQLRQLNKYKKAIIRIQFPDRAVLQGTFKPIETIKDVFEFVREYLDEKSTDFYLYSTPPKEVLNQDSSLIQLGFAPGALIHFGTSNLEPRNYLRKDLQDKFTSNSVASLAASKMRAHHTRTCKVYDNDEDLELNTGLPAISNDVPSTSTGITDTVEKKVSYTKSPVPKWFKP